MTNFVLISYGGPRKLVHKATFVLVSLFSKPNNILFRDTDIGCNITKRSKGMNNRRLCDIWGERRSCDRKGHMELLRE